MKKLTFRCELLSDVILNASGASDGNFLSHDYIPGSNFLGITARNYQDAKNRGIAYDLFHNGNVRFGDAHLVIDGQRSLKVPAAWFYKKGDALSDGKIWLHHFLDQDQYSRLIRDGIQLKQARSNFFVNSGDSNEINIISFADMKYFSIKSAYDRQARRAKESQMFGYMAMRKGSEWEFSVTVAGGNGQTILDFVKDNLSGRRSIGRSRSAQYGRVNIVFDREENCSEMQPVSENATAESYEIIIYAESRLAFMDRFGMPTVQPEPKMLGLPKGSKIVWDKTQILTYRYAPWNGIRRTRDADRICIDKGSVIVASVPEGSAVSSIPRTVGYFRNEGLGVIRVNPDFLCQARPDGRLSIPIPSADASGGQDVEAAGETTQSETSLISWLGTQEKLSRDNKRIMKLVNDFILKYGDRFRDKMASQWGNIRSLAERAQNAEDLMTRLFHDDTEQPDQSGYLMHGVAENKWRKNGRRDVLKEFLIKQPEDIRIRLTIKLASEMAKTS